jgi:hypothetical protein
MSSPTSNDSRKRAAAPQDLDSWVAHYLGHQGPKEDPSAQPGLALSVTNLSDAVLENLLRMLQDEKEKRGNGAQG